ncbi:MAG: hypothetical protein WAU70_10940 [Flavobacteriales bacterium]
MKKLLPTAPALLLAFCCHAQNDPVMLAPNWKVGDVRTLHISKSLNETVNDTVRINKTVSSDAPVKVTKNTATAYTIEMPYQGGRLMKALQANLMGDYEGGGSEEFKLKPDLRYEVRKEDGRSDLVNWEDVQKYIVTELDTMRANSEDTTATGKAMRLFLPMLGTKESVQWLVGDQIGWVTGVYGRTMLPKDTLHIEERIIDPLLFRSGDSTTTKTSVTISSLDLAKQRMVVRSEVHYNTKPYLERAKQEILKSAGAGLKTEKQQIDAKNKAKAFVTSFEMTAKNLTNTTVNTRTSWPSKVVSNTTINSKRTGKRTAMVETWMVEVKE